VSRGGRWLEALADRASEAAIPSVVTGAASLAGKPSVLLAVVPDAQNPYPRARRGEVGVREGLALATAITGIVDADRALADAERRAIIAVVDVPSQAYGRLEETVGLHWSLAAAVDAYARARTAGHPVVTLVVGTALSGGFLAHGLQANQVLALADPGVEIHAMHKPAAARITRRTVAELDALAKRIPPLSYDVRDWASLGICQALIDVRNADDPSEDDVRTVRSALDDAVLRARRGPRDLRGRLESPGAKRTRVASRRVRDALTAQWAEELRAAA
jgi:biotin-independent malonate decarboxylase gamma subunit